MKKANNRVWQTVLQTVRWALFVVLGGMVMSPAQAVMRYIDTIHYESLPPDKWPSQYGNGQVLEFFSYGCPHCRSIADAVATWEAQTDLTLIKVPVVWNPPFRLLGQLHYALVAAGVEKTHGKALFAYLHDQKQRVAQRAHIEQFLASLPGDPAAVLKAFDAPERNTDLKAADALARQIGISGVPSFIVNGRYRVSLQMAGSPDELFRIIDFLVHYGPLNDDRR